MCPRRDQARQLAEQLGDAVTFYKLGLELMMAGGYFELIDWMIGARQESFRRSENFSMCRRRSAVPSPAWPAAA